MLRTKGIAQHRIVFGIGLLLVGVAISSFSSVFFRVSNWRIVGFEKEFYAILGDMGFWSLAAGSVCILAAVFVKRDPARKVVHAIIVNTTLILGGAFFAFVILEVVLHVKYHDVQIGGGGSPSRYTFYPKYYHLNNDGFRDTPHSLRKPEGTYRIVIVGDSFTFGSGVKRIDDLYFKILEKKLQQAYPKETFESVSLARKGWNTAQEFEAFRRRGIYYDPDLVIIGYTLNDADRPAIKSRLSRAFHHDHLLPYPYGKFLFATSFAYCIIEKKLKALPFLREDNNIREAFYKEIYNGDNLKHHETILRDFIAFIHRRDRGVIVVLFPAVGLIYNSDYPYFEIHQFVAQTVKGAGAEFLDLSDPLKKSGIPNLTINEFDGHPNEEVHRIAGTELFNVIRRNGFLPRGTSSLETD